jgi:CheY-like chemotaxis protein/two-component sensor histidine kinase
VLDLAQLESGEVSLELERVDISSEVEDVVKLLEPIAQQKGLDLDIKVRAQNTHANVDVACINRITNNLVGNAIKFTDEGRVTVEVDTTEQSVLIRIEDTGVGIEDDFLEHLFDEFRQESSGLQRSHEGSGLGLAITKRLVDLLGGTINVESEKGVGSTFTVFLPRAESPAAAPSASPPASTSPTTELTFTGSVLAVEDNPLTRELIAHQLGEHCTAEVVAGPDEALSRAQQQTFDVLILDIHLSAGQNGVELLHDLRALPEYECVPAVALTAYALPADREQFLDEGFDFYLSKPFTREELYETIERATRSPSSMPTS